MPKLLYLFVLISNFYNLQQEQEQSKTAAAPKGGASATSASTESKETDIERKKREADELLKGIIPDDVIDGTAGLHCFFSKIFFLFIFSMTWIHSCSKAINQVMNLFQILFIILWTI